ncbi:hypothetical protein PSAC2689_20604 [Paraburkholderia sacchari]
MRISIRYTSMAATRDWRFSGCTTARLQLPTERIHSGSGSPYNTPHGFRLIKTGQLAAGTVIPGGTVIAYGAIGGLNVIDMVLASNIAVTAAACTTPDVAIPLGDHLQSEFKGVNTFSSSTSFSFALSNCPAGMKSVTYRVDPATPVLNAAQSVVALDGSSTATGVGVQLLTVTARCFRSARSRPSMGMSRARGAATPLPSGLAITRLPPPSRPVRRIPR